MKIRKYENREYARTYGEGRLRDAAYYDKGASDTITIYTVVHILFMIAIIAVIVWAEDWLYNALLATFIVFGVFDIWMWWRVRPFGQTHIDMDEYDYRKEEEEETAKEA